MQAPDPRGAIVAAAQAQRSSSAGPEVDLWASCPGGLEPEVAGELAAMGWRPLPVGRPSDLPGGEVAGLSWQRGSVYGRADLATVLRTVAARTPVRMALLLGVVDAEDLEDVREAVAALDLSMLPHAAFAVRPERHGAHPFRSPDIGRVAGAAVIDTVRARTGRRLSVDLDHPVIEIRVELWQSVLPSPGAWGCGISTTLAVA